MLDACIGVLPYALMPAIGEGVLRVFSALLTPTIAVVAAYIAWQQHKTNKNQLRLALFDRRLKVFNSAGKLIATILREARIEWRELGEFRSETNESDFLFGPDITNYLNELYTKAIRVHALVTAQNPENAAEQTQVFTWFEAQLDEVKKKFGRYMAFKEAAYPMDSGVNIKSGFNRLFVALTVLWILCCLFLYPIQQRRHALNVYEHQLRDCYEREIGKGQANLGDCIQWAETKSGENEWALKNFYARESWLLALIIVVVPLFAYGVCRGVAAVCMWVWRGFRTAPPLGG